MTEPGLRERLLGLPPSERTSALEQVVVEEFKAALLMDDSDDLPRDDNYFDLGLTSLRAVEVKQRLERRLGCALETGVVFGTPSVARLVEHVRREKLPELFGMPMPAAEMDDGQTVMRTLVTDLLDDLYDEEAAS